jgi:hypothetical protein
MADCQPNQRFNRLIAGGGGVGIGLPGIDVGAALTGCCNGILKFAYIVSAPLHKQGFFEFWGNPDLNIADKFAVGFDLILHLLFWFVPFGFELWMSLESDRGSYLNQELQMASLWSLIVALIGILIAQLFGLMEQDAGKLYATTYALIIGGGIASVIFTVLWFMTGGPWLMNPTSPDNPVTTFRFMMYWCIALKTLAVTTAAQNAAFWGPCKQTAECCPTTGAPLAAPAAAASGGMSLGGGLTVKVGA